MIAANNTKFNVQNKLRGKVRGYWAWGKTLRL